MRDSKEYMKLLFRIRAVSGVFAVKLQYWQFNRYLTNAVGENLFGDATVVHLYHTDIAYQFASWRVARATGRWDHSARKTTAPFDLAAGAEPEKLRHDVEFFMQEESGFRRLFLLLDIHPVFVTLNDIGRTPRAAVERIAASLGVSINEQALNDMIAQCAPYHHDARAVATVNAGVGEALRREVFPRSDT